MQSNSTILLSTNEWEAIVSKNGNLSANWSDTIIKKMSQINPYCSFAIKWRWLKKKNSRKNSDAVFKTSGYCTFHDCSLTFSLKITHNLTMTVSFSGAIKHSKCETRARPIRKDRREHLRKLLKHQSPSSLRAKMYVQLQPGEYMSGKRDLVGNGVSVFQKISSEGNKELQSHPDIIMSTILLKNELESKDGLSCICKGYIQRIIAYPFGVLLFTELGVWLYHHLAKQNALQCDATGTIVECKELGKALYYALTVQNPTTKSVVAVAELITTDHSVVMISNFLEAFRKAEATTFGYGNVVTPPHVVLDRSLVLQLSFLKVFNYETLSDYLHRCYRIVTGVGKEKDFSKTFIHACISHVMKSASRDMKKFW